MAVSKQSLVNHIPDETALEGGELLPAARSTSHCIPVVGEVAIRISHGVRIFTLNERLRFAVASVVERCVIPHIRLVLVVTSRGHQPLELAVLLAHLAAPVHGKGNIRDCARAIVHARTFVGDRPSVCRVRVRKLLMAHVCIHRRNRGSATTLVPKTPHHNAAVISISCHHACRTLHVVRDPPIVVCEKVPRQLRVSRGSARGHPWQRTNVTA